INLDNNTLMESHLTRALIDLTELNNQYIVFLEGHGEPSPFSKENHDYLLLSQALKNQGFKPLALNLANTHAIPENTSLLVLSAPKTEYLPTELALIHEYLNHGGNLLWMINPDSARLSPLENL